MEYTQGRKQPRYRTDLPVEIIAPDGTRHFGTTNNLSMGGLFLRTSARLSPGTRVRLALRAPVLELATDARIAHVIGPEEAVKKEHPAGLGIAFDVLPSEARSRLQRHLFVLFREGKKIPLVPPPVVGTPVEEHVMADASALLKELASQPNGMTTEQLEAKTFAVEAALRTLPWEAAIPSPEGPVTPHEVLSRLQAHVLLRRAESVCGSGDPDAPHMALRAAEAWPAPAIQERAADVLLRCGNHQGAMGLAQEILKHAPGNVAARRIQLSAYEALREWTRAERAAEELLRMLPQDPEITRRLESIRAQHKQSTSGPRKPVSRGALHPGEKISRYEILEKLGEGGMAHVWLARQQGPGGFSKTVVLKTIAPQWAGVSESVELFFDEARLAAQLSHPNVVQIFELDSSDNTHLIVMEHLQGRNLSQVEEALRTQNLRFPPALAARIASECCAGLHYAHTLTSPAGQPLRIVHRDVTPENIFLTYQGQVKVLDFGIARAEENTHHTKPGCTRGKLPYMAPEQVRAEAMDHRVDVWAMGVNLYVLLTGKLPFHGRSELQCMLSIVQNQCPPPSALVPGLPPTLDAIVMKALQKDPALRFESMGHMRDALEQFLKGEDASATQVAALMESLFPASTDPLRRRVAEALGGQPETAPEPISLDTREWQGMQVAEPVEPTRARGTPPAAVPGVEVVPVAAAPSRSRRGVLLGSVGAGAAAMGVALWMSGVFPAAPTQEPPAPTETPAAVVHAEPVTPPTSTVQQAGSGGLSIDTNIRAQVFLDDKPVGPTPLTLEKVQAGTHRVRVVGAEGAMRELTLGVVPGETTQRFVVLEQGYLQFKVPARTVVHVNGRKVGTAPLNKLKLWEGTHEVRLTNSRLRARQELTVQVRPNAIEEVSTTLRN